MIGNVSFNVSHPFFVAPVKKHSSPVALLLLLLLSAFPYSGSPKRKSIFYLARSTSSPSLAPTLSTSSLAKSIHLLLALPLFLLPDTARSIILIPRSLLPSFSRVHASLALHSEVYLLALLASFAVPLTYSFLILSFLVTPSAHLTVFNSATSFFPPDFPSLPPFPFLKAWLV